MSATSSIRTKRPLYDNSYLRKIRKSQDLTMDQLAAITQIKKSKLGRLERGETRIKAEDKQRIAAAVHISVDTLEHFDPIKAVSCHKQETDPPAEAPSHDHICALYETALSAFKSENEHLRTEVSLLHACIARHEAFHQEAIAALKLAQEVVGFLLKDGKSERKISTFGVRCSVFDI